MKREEIDFPPAHEALRQDVRQLGAMVGDMLREQCGVELFSAVERARETAIDRRAELVESDALLAACRFDDQAAALDFVRGFAAWFRMVNLSEQVHRIRRQREWAASDQPQPAGLEATLGKLRANGVSCERFLEALGSLRIEPVLTAHPTEATRRSILEKEQRMVRYLVDRFDPGRSARDNERVLDRVRMELTIAWQTAEQSGVRPSVADEAEHAHYYLANVLYRITPALHEEMAAAIQAVWGVDQAPERLPTLLRFGSWVGGDMDGNPNVGPDTVLDTLAEQRAQVIHNYLAEVGSLRRSLSQTLGRISISPPLAERLESYRSRMPTVQRKLPPRYADMPYREMLYFIEDRLRETRADRAGRYLEATELLADLDLMTASLSANDGTHAGMFPLQRFRRRVDVFGFHLASLDLRVDSGDLHAAVAELAGDPEWPERAPETRIEHLRAWLEDGSSSHQREAEHPVFRLVQAASQGRQRFGVRSVQTLIVSMSRNADDVLAAWWLARAAGIEDGGFDFVPLFETVQDLQAAESVMRGLLELPIWKQLLADRGGRQMIMLGYSDSNKDGGLVASRWSLHDAQRRLVALFAEHEINVVFFHGRGGTIGRGGGKTEQAILAAPPGSVSGWLRTTEQGEVIHRKFSLRPIALRNLEQSAGAVAQALLLPESARTDTVWERNMARLAEASRSAYRDLVYGAPDFVDYFQQATPIDVIQRMRMGSRPASRRPDAGIEGLRAIPWVFAWAQSRHALPGWYGLGSGLDALAAEVGADELETMAQQWPFMRTVLVDAEMAMAKSDLDIAARYATLAGALGERYFPRIREEFERTEDWICRLTGQDSLLAGDSTLQRSILLRNPYVDPISFVQVDTLPRWRASNREDTALEQVLIATVHGIAQGLQNTG